MEDNIRLNYISRIEKYVDSANIELEKIKGISGTEQKNNYYIGIISACDKSKSIFNPNDFDALLIETKDNNNKCHDRENFNQAKMFEGMNRGYLTCQQYLQESIGENIDKSQLTENTKALLQEIGNKILSKSFAPNATTGNAPVISEKHLKEVFSEYGITIKKESKTFRL